MFPSNLKMSTWNQKLFHRKRVRESIPESCHVRKDKQAIFHGSDPAWMMPAYHQILFDGNLVTLVMRGFNSTECFENIKEDGGFLETAEYCGNYYGTLSAPVKKALNEGRDMILILETEGAMKVKEIFPTAITFFIAAPAAEVKTRMKETGIVGEDCKKRLAEIQKEISMIPKYDYIIMNKNGKLQENAKVIHSIIKGHKMKTSKSLGEIEALREEYN